MNNLNVLAEYPDYFTDTEIYLIKQIADIQFEHVQLLCMTSNSDECCTIPITMKFIVDGDIQVHKSRIEKGNYKGYFQIRVIEDNLTHSLTVGE